MLTADEQKKIAKLLKLDETKFAEALKSDKEVALEIPELSFFTSEELSTRDTNQKKLGYTEGKDAGLEIFIKEQRTKHGLDFEGKDPDKFVTAFQAKILADAKIEPNQKLQEKDAVIAKLQTNIQEFEKKYNAEAQRVKQLGTKSKLLSVIPSGLPVDQEEVLLSAQARGIVFEEDESGKIVAKRNGEVIRDEKTQAEKDYKVVLTDYITERKWAPVTGGEPPKGGRGGNSDRTPASISKMSEAEAEWKAQGKSPNSSEFQAYVTDLVKNNQDFDLDN